MPEQIDPEVDSQFAQGKRLAAERGTPPGIDPVTGERAAITYRQIFNETGGDEARSIQIFHSITQAGGFGDVGINQALDIRSLSRSKDDIRAAINRGVDLQGRELDLYATRQLEQQAQHQDNLIVAVNEALELIKKG